MFSGMGQLHSMAMSPSCSVLLGRYETRSKMLNCFAFAPEFTAKRLNSLVLRSMKFHLVHLLQTELANCVNRAQLQALKNNSMKTGCTGPAQVMLHQPT